MEEEQRKKVKQSWKSVGAFLDKGCISLKQQDQDIMEKKTYKIQGSQQHCSMIILLHV